MRLCPEIEDKELKATRQTARLSSVECQLGKKYVTTQVQYVLKALHNLVLCITQKKQSHGDHKIYVEPKKAFSFGSS